MVKERFVTLAGCDNAWLIHYVHGGFWHYDARGAKPWGGNVDLASLNRLVEEGQWVELDRAAAVALLARNGWPPLRASKDAPANLEDAW